MNFDNFGIRCIAYVGCYDHQFLISVPSQEFGVALGREQAGKSGVDFPSMSCVVAATQCLWLVLERNMGLCDP